jgi:hypothetical protein
MQGGTISESNAEAMRIGARFDPLGDDYLANPYPYIAEARRAAPIFFSKKLDHWIVTRYSLIYPSGTGRISVSAAASRDCRRGSFLRRCRLAFLACGWRLT